MATIAFNLIVDHEEMVARLEAAEATPDTISTLEYARERLKANNVVAGIDEAELAHAFARLPALDKPGEVFVVARGRRPVHGIDGRVDFKVDVSGQPIYRAEDAAARIDFRQATKISTVKQGDIIAELVPPTKGEKGFTLSGKELPARDGKPAILRPGSGAQVDAAGRFFTAAAEGRPVYCGGIISVSPVYEVAGDVDLKTGNVKFNGHVIVQGNVTDDAVIEANSVEINGVVGAAAIIARGAVTIRGGINGRDRGRIEAQGNVFAKYINQTAVIAYGDVVAVREIVNSRIWCLGRVRADTILGGECLALRGIEAGLLGSEIGVTTLLEPGANFEVRKVENEMAALAEKIESLLRPIQPFFGDRNRFRALPDEKKQAFRDAYAAFCSYMESYLALGEELRKLEENQSMTPVKQVFVRRMLHNDVFIRTSLCQKQFKTQITGPAAVVEDIDSGSLRAVPWKPGADIIDSKTDNGEKSRGGTQQKKSA